MFNKVNENRADIQEKTSSRIHDGPAIVWPSVTNDKFKKFIPHLGPTVWNGLPSRLRNIIDKNDFKNQIKKHYENKFQNLAQQ